MIINLTAKERAKFAAYCLQEAETDRGLIEKMEEMQVPDAITKHKRAQALAYALVGHHLNSGEEFHVRA